MNCAPAITPTATRRRSRRSTWYATTSRLKRSTVRSRRALSAHSRRPPTNLQEPRLVPSAPRSASKTLRTISRGSRLALPTCDTLRFFVWWKDGDSRTDIDLAAVFFSDDWKRLGDVSYYNLKEWGAAHSGDITSAPNGAAEFIDLHMPTDQEKGVRYVQMGIYSFMSQAFKDLPESFAGCIARQEV